MRAKYEPQNGHSVTIATKVSQADKEKLKAIAESFGLSLFGLLQALLTGLLRYFDKGSFVTDEHCVMYSAIGNVMKNAKNSFSPIAIRGHDRQSITGAILFIERKAGQQPQLMKVCKNKRGNWIETYNYDTMLTDFLNAICPDVTKRLRDEAKRCGYFSITHTLHELIMQRTNMTGDEAMRAEIEEMFADIRIPTGQKLNDGVYYKRGSNRGGEYTTIARRTKYRADM